MKRLLKYLFIISFLTVIGPAPSPARAQGPPPPFVPGEILVKFKPSVSVLGAQGSLRAEGLRPTEVLSALDVVRVKVEPGREMETIAKLLARGDVEVAGLNYRVYALETIPNDYSISSQWSLARINAPQAWDVTTGGYNVIIAIVDSGVELGHEDFQCPNKLVSGWDFINRDNQPNDDNGHGTHVAGIAAACSNNGLGISGVAWGAQIMPLKVLDSGGNGSIASVAAGIQYATDHGARIINLSLGCTASCDPDSILRDAIQYAYDHGVLVVAAAGNFAQSGNPVIEPAVFSTVKAVAATTSSDGWASFSEHHSYVEVAAPGMSIFSTYKGGTYVWLSGTSMASPHVAGLAALIWSLEPRLTRDQVWDIIQSTVDDLGEPGKDDYFGYGRINAGRAMAKLAEIGLLTAGGEIVNNGELGFIADDKNGPFPTTLPVQVSPVLPSVITWTAVISPPVSWLTLTPASSGLASASSPGQFTLMAMRPEAHGTFTTTLVVTGTTSEGGKVGPAVTDVRLNYLPKLYQYRFPMIYKNGGN